MLKVSVPQQVTKYCIGHEEKIKEYLLIVNKINWIWISALTYEFFKKGLPLCFGYFLPMQTQLFAKTALSDKFARRSIKFVAKGQFFFKPFSI